MLLVLWLHRQKTADSLAECFAVAEKEEKGKRAIKTFSVKTKTFWAMPLTWEARKPDEVCAPWTTSSLRSMSKVANSLEAQSQIPRRSLTQGLCFKGSRCCPFVRLCTAATSSSASSERKPAILKAGTTMRNVSRIVIMNAAKLARPLRSLSSQAYAG